MVGYCFLFLPRLSARGVRWFRGSGSVQRPLSKSVRERKAAAVNEAVVKFNSRREKGENSR